MGIPNPHSNTGSHPSKMHLFCKPEAHITFHVSQKRQGAPAAAGFLYLQWAGAYNKVTIAFSSSMLQRVLFHL